MTKILKTIEEKNVIHTIVSGDFKIDYAAYGLVRGEEAKKAAKTTKTTKTIEEKKAAKKAYNAAYYQAHKAERKAAYQAKKAAKMAPDYAALLSDWVPGKLVYGQIYRDDLFELGAKLLKIDHAKFKWVNRQIVNHKEEANKIFDLVDKIRAIRREDVAIKEREMAERAAARAEAAQKKADAEKAIAAEALANAVIPEGATVFTNKTLPGYAYATEKNLFACVSDDGNGVGLYYVKQTKNFDVYTNEVKNFYVARFFVA